MLSTNAEIAPMHCCRGEPGCLAGIMLLFQTDWGTQHAGVAVVSVTILAPSPSRCTYQHAEKLAVFVSNFHVWP